MATLNREERLPDYDAVIRYHDSRAPSDDVVMQLGESLQLARAMVGAAVRTLTSALDDASTSQRDALVRQVLRYHFQTDVDDPPVVRDVISVLEETASGLAGSVQLSDVLNRYSWDFYRVYRDDDSWEDVRITLPGSFRPITETHPKGGYVHYTSFDDGATWYRGSIHIEFSDAAIYPKLWMARNIVHEATHKFPDPDTEDHAYADGPEYEQLTIEERVNNADSYAYTVLSLHQHELIKDLYGCIRAVPQDDRSGVTRSIARRPATRV